MVEYDRSHSFNATDSLRICVAGVGGAGSNVLDRIAIDRIVDASLVSFQTDVRVLNKSSAPHKVQLGTDLMRGIGSGGDPDLGREAALYSREEIRAAVDGHDMVFLCLGLGGGTGSGAGPVIAEIAKSTGAIVVIFATVPFSFEGRRRQSQSKDALERLEKSADALILFDNNRMGELVLPKDGIQKAFAQGDQLIAQSIRGVTAMVGAPGLVKLGLADLVAALRVSEGRCLFGFGEAKGQNRGTEALKRALKSPLINQGELLQNAKNLLVHVVGGESLTLAEVESVMKQLGRHVPDETQILFGIGIDSKLGDSITISLVSALSAQELATARKPVEAEQPQPAPAPAPAPVARAPRQQAPKPAPAPVAPAPQIDPTAMDDLFESKAPPAPPAPTPVAVEPPRATTTPPPLPVVEKPVEPVRAVVAPPAPPPAPEPEVIEDEPVAESEIVYDSTDDADRYDLDEQVEEHVEPAHAPAPQRESTRVKLSAVIGTERREPVAPVEPPVDEIRLEPEPPRVVEPAPETAKVQLPRTRTSTTVVHPAAAHGDSVVIAREPRAAEPEPQPVKKPAPVEQATMKLGGEDRGRFKDTEPSLSAQSSEDLDTPTWMRLRKRLSR